jgi:ubiquinone/menaquinone biosynthesis C-methylase UbiE
MNTIAPARAAEPAEIYDRSFVPALFARWGPVVADAARVAPGDRVLDVACGTGALTLAAAERVGRSGAVTGLDPNPDMLAVARAKPAAIDWRQGRAEDLPFSDASFDAVVSQFGLMFFDDPARAFAEMHRVLAPGGRLAVAVFDAIETAPGYDALARLLDRLFGHEVGDAMRAPFVLGDAGRLRSLAATAFPEAEVSRHDGWVSFPSVADLVSTEHSCIWTLGGLIDDDQAAHLRREAERDLRPFVQLDGAVGFAMPALILAATMPARPG